MWYQVVPSLMWLPLRLMRSLHLGQVPITTLLLEISEGLLYRTVSTPSAEPAP